MRVHYTGRQVEITPQVKAQVEERLNKIHKVLGRHLDLEAHAILSLVRHRHITEVTLNLKNAPVVGAASTNDQYSSIQEALDKLEKQVLRNRERGREIKRRAPRSSRVTTPRGILGLAAGSEAPTAD